MRKGPHNFVVPLFSILPFDRQLILSIELPQPKGRQSAFAASGSKWGQSVVKDRIQLQESGSSNHGFINR
jgi:hypothetical protein